MTKKIFFLTIILFSGFFLAAAEFQDISGGVDFSAGLRVVYADSGIIFPETDGRNSLISVVTAIEVDAEISDYLTVGVIAGYNWNHFRDTQPVLSLPLSLDIDGKSYNSMVFGLNLKSEFFSSGDFSVFARIEFCYFKQFQQELEIPLSIVTGSAVAKNSFYEGRLDLLLKYHGFSGFVLFLGPQLYLLNGNFSVSETIADISGEEELNYRQRNLIGLQGGISVELGLDWEVSLEIGFFSRFSIGAGIFYAF